jgi:hypothetical protein
MLESHNALVAGLLGDRRYGKRMALIRFCLPEKIEKKKIVKNFARKIKFFKFINNHQKKYKTNCELFDYDLVR